MPTGPTLDLKAAKALRRPASRSRLAIADEVIA
jgi:hypothetical protein